MRYIGKYAQSLMHSKISGYTSFVVLPSAFVRTDRFATLVTLDMATYS